MLIVARSASEELTGSDQQRKDADEYPSPKDKDKDEGSFALNLPPHDTQTHTCVFCLSRQLLAYQLEIQVNHVLVLYFVPSSSSFCLPSLPHHSSYYAYDLIRENEA